MGHAFIRRGRSRPWRTRNQLTASTTKTRHNGKTSKLFNAIANGTSQAAGRAQTFLIAAGIVVVVRPDVWFLGHVAARHQYRDDDHYLPDGLPDPELAEPGQCGDPGQARRVDPGERRSQLVRRN